MIYYSMILITGIATYTVHFFFFKASGVPVLSSIDRFERQTFHTDKIWQHVWGTFPKYLVSYSRDPMKDVSYFRILSSTLYLGI